MQEADLLSGAPVEATVPFALWILPTGPRVYMQALYRFARGADDVADDPVLPKAEKDQHLRALRQALQSGEPQGLPLYARDFATLARRKLVKLQLALDVIHGLEDDVSHEPMRDYEMLLSYARLVAVPLGRMAMELLDEDKADLTATDALCIALQLLNVVRDASKDYLVLNRVYLPGDWLRQGGVPLDDLTHTTLTPRLKSAMGRVLDRASAFLDASRPLPQSLTSRRLRILMRSVYLMARMELQKLKTENPLAGRVHLSMWEQFQALWQAALEEIFPKRYAPVQETPKATLKEPALERAVIAEGEDEVTN